MFNYERIWTVILHILLIYMYLLQLVGCRVLPWAKANLNYTAQTLIISAGTILLFSLLIVHVCALFAQYSLLNDSF